MNEQQKQICKELEAKFNIIKLDAYAEACREVAKLEDIEYADELPAWSSVYRLFIDRKMINMGFEQSKQDELLYGKNIEDNFIQFCFGDPSETFDACEVMAVYIDGENI